MVSAAERSGVVQSRTFPRFRFTGSHRTIGEQYGEACADLIHRHRDLALARLGTRASVSPDEAQAKALRYRPWVQHYAPFFDEEIQGVAAGAGISLAEAYLLQLRAELAAPVLESDECTSFAVQPEAARDGITLVGQNADLPAFYGEISIVAEIVPDDMPSLLMLLPAGQVSYIGINDRGLGVFANFVTCDGWRLGLPRYFYSRLALTQASADDAIDLLRSVRRASSRNLMLLDASGVVADLETTPTRDARLEPENGLLAHSNHYVAETLIVEERSSAEYVENSRARLDRMRELLHANHGRLDVPTMQEILRDRACHPHNICRAPGDLESDVITFASVVAEPTEGRMWVAVGPPHEHDYDLVQFSA
jgi:isopenicillin-N N-acyltransferase-like protein